MRQQHIVPPDKAEFIDRYLEAVWSGDRELIEKMKGEATEKWNWEWPMRKTERQISLDFERE